MSKVTVVSRPNRITIASKGVQGAPGPVGEQGIQGPKGDTGDVTPEAIAARDAAQEAAAAAEASAGRLALANTGMLAFIAGTSSLETARVVDPRDGGYWQWQTGDVSALVAADPYGAFWRPPASAPSGASGAWMRIVEDGIFDAEWVLPDAMPANAQVRLNAMIAALPNDARRLLLPRRQVNVTATVNFSKPIEYVGAGRECPFDGGGGTGFFPITISASGARLVNISSGNVTGTAVQGEPGGFHVTDGLPLGTSDGSAIEGVSFIDCHAYNARTGLRIGYKSTPSGTPDVISVQGARDVYIENFNCNGIMRIGIETMRSHGVTIVGGNIRMAEDTFSSAGIKRGVRVVGAHNVGITGLRIVGDSVQPNSGVSIEYAGNQGNYSGSTDVVCTGVRVENCREAAFRVDERSQNVLISGCQAIGWADTEADSFCAFASSMVAEQEARNIKVTGCQSTNIAVFMLLRGRVVGLDVHDNTHISNSSTTSRFFRSGENPANDELIEGRFTGNRGYTNTTSGGVFRYAGMSAGSTITLDDNEFTPDASGNMFSFSGAGTVRMKRRDSNQALPRSLWGAVRTAFAQGEYS